MPIVPAGVKMDFFSKQVRTSRNISGGWWATILMGGLNYQIEHHLFPNMPRDSLRRAQPLVRAHCAALGVPYTPEMIANARADVRSQASADADTADLVKRYPKALARDYDGNAGRVTEADALIAYLQVLGTLVDFKLYNDKANIR